MSRQQRILYSGACYHVMNRGANHQTIFFKNEHRRMFLEILREISRVYKVEVHAYCLMTNHYHLLLRTTLPNLPDAMRYLDSVFTSRLNKDVPRDGPLLRGRYKAILIEADEYLLHVSRYIHLNPLDAGMVKELSHYLWSSYRCYIGDDIKPDWLHTEFVFGYFSGGNLEQQYKDFTDLGNDSNIKNFYEAKKIEPVLSTKKFIEDLRHTIPLSEEITPILGLEIKWTLYEILDIVIKITGKAQPEIFASARGKPNIARALFIYLSRIIAGYKLNEIASFIANCHYSTLSSALAHFEKKMTKDEHLISLISLCLAELKAVKQSRGAEE